ncbi:MAG: hypothetical protein MUE85_13950 [Microscillaceae bacterium]|nr:hypothetical protein [Microscillaceae bacterium]
MVQYTKDKISQNKCAMLYTHFSLMWSKVACVRKLDSLRTQATLDST